MGVKWGIMGTAGICHWGTIPGMLKSKNSELYAIAGRSQEKVDAYMKEFGIQKGYIGYDALLADPEVQAVYIPLPNHIHCEWVIKALEAKKHVLCEKPLAMNATEVEKMFETARKNNVLLTEAYAYLHSQYVQSLKMDVRSGIIGDIDFIDTAFITQGYKEDIRLHKEFGGGAMYDLGCYCTTLILSLVDSDVETVHACADIQKGVDFLTLAGLNFASGARASFTVGMSLGENTNSRYDRLFIHGTKGTILSHVEYNQEGNLKYTITTGGKTIEREVSVYNNYALEFDQFNACIMNGEKPLINEEFSLKNMRLMDEILKKIDY